MNARSAGVGRYSMTRYPFAADSDGDV